MKMEIKINKLINIFGDAYSKKPYHYLKIHNTFWLKCRKHETVMNVLHYLSVYCFANK